MKLSRKWDAKEREVVRRHHRKLYAKLRREWGLQQADPSEWIPGFRESVERLLDQGYCFADVSAMIGVSRERVRQWVTEWGMEPAARQGSSIRVFDWDRMMFVATDQQSAGKLNRDADLKGRNQAREERQERLRIERETRARLAVVAYWRENREVPNAAALAEALGYPRTGNGMNMMHCWLGVGESRRARRIVGRRRLDRIYAELGFIRPARSDDGMTRAA